MEKNQYINEWYDLIEGYKSLDPAIQTYLADQPDELLRHEVYRTLIGSMSFAYIHMFLSDIEHPNFRPFLNQANAAFAANPDDTYYITPVDSGGTYRISGFRGSVRFVDLQVGSGTLLTRGTQDQGKTLSNYSLDDLTLGENGEFEVTLSAKKPEGYEGDWWYLSP